MTLRPTDKSSIGTSRRGTFTASYDDLVWAFGEPSETDEYKVSTEWVLEDDHGRVWTVYDWQATNLYDGENQSVEAFRALPSYEWHVGGAHDADVAEFLAEGPLARTERGNP